MFFVSWLLPILYRKRYCVGISAGNSIVVRKGKDLNDLSTLEKLPIKYRQEDHKIMGII